MKFHRVNETTLNCIITEEDLRENGLAFRDFFSRKKEVLTFIRNVITQGVSSEKITFTGERIAMRISVLPDRSISLTVTDQADSLLPEDLLPELMAGDLQPDTAQETEDRGFEAPREYIIRFTEILKAVRYSRTIPQETMPPSALYYEEETRNYLLCIRGSGGESPEFERTVLSANEFGTLQTVSAGTLAHVREHCRVVLAENALQQLQAL